MKPPSSLKSCCSLSLKPSENVRLSFVCIIFGFFFFFLCHFVFPEALKQTPRARDGRADMHLQLPFGPASQKVSTETLIY